MMNQAKLDRDEYLMGTLENESCLDFPGFRQAVELRDASRRSIFLVDVSSNDMNESFQLQLVGEHLIYLLTEVRKLLLGGVVNHISVSFSVCVSSLPIERQRARTATSGGRASDAVLGLQLR